MLINLGDGRFLDTEKKEQFEISVADLSFKYGSQTWYCNKETLHAIYNTLVEVSDNYAYTDVDEMVIEEFDNIS